MLTTLELMRLAKEAQGIPSNYLLARVLDVPEITVRRWNTGKNHPSDEMAARLAEMAGLDAGQVVASIKAEREAPGPMRDMWAGVADRLARVAVGTATASVVLLGVTGSPDALIGMQQSAADRAGQGPSDDYVKWIVKELVRAVLTWCGASSNIQIRNVRSSVVFA